MRRRDLISLIGGSAVAWPLMARAQQPDTVRRIGVLPICPRTIPRGEPAMRRSSSGYGNWAGAKTATYGSKSARLAAISSGQYAAELVALAPDVIVTTGSAGLIPLLQVTRTIPIVFTIVPDPVGAGFVDFLARPGGNATGFSQFEYGLSSKWLELLKEVAPGVSRVAVMREPGLTAAIAQFAALEAVAPSLHVELVPLNLRDGGGIEREIDTFARSPADGLIVTSGPLAAVHRDLIIQAAARHRLPAVYVTRYMATGGGLMSYGPDFAEQYRLAAGYVDRILKGEKPADLPVQAPTKYETVINLKTAKALGLTVPQALLARADEVIE